MSSGVSKPKLMRRRRRLESCITAILERDDGVPYQVALESNGVTPAMFTMAIVQSPERLLEFADLNLSMKVKKTLEQILTDEQRRTELFRMEEDFIRQQYLQVTTNDPRQRQKRFCEGTFLHPQNQQLLAYCALSMQLPELGTRVRAKVVKELGRLPANLVQYFRRIKLGSLMYFLGGPWAVLRDYDRAYQAKASDASMFDLTQPEHQHEWSMQFHVPRNYWQNPLNVEKAVYHVLTENNPLLGSGKREDVVRGVEGLPADLYTYLASLGLASLMSAAFVKGERASPLALIKVFDRAYQQTTGDASMFDSAHEPYLKIAGRNRLIVQQHKIASA